MARRHIQTEHVRSHELSDRAVACPNALDYDKQTRYGVKAKPGMWVTYRELDARGQLFGVRSGRVLGRVEAGPCGETPAIDGHISVLALSDTLQFAYIRWVAPEEVAEVSIAPPHKLLSWITGELPSAELVHKLSAYGTLSESYIDKADHHVNAWQHGVSPAAWDAGVRIDEASLTELASEAAAYGRLAIGCIENHHVQNAVLYTVQAARIARKLQDCRLAREAAETAKKVLHYAR